MLIRGENLQYEDDLSSRGVAVQFSAGKAKPPILSRTEDYRVPLFCMSDYETTARAFWQKPQASRWETETHGVPLVGN